MEDAAAAEGKHGAVEASDGGGETARRGEDEVFEGAADGDGEGDGEGDEELSESLLRANAGGKALAQLRRLDLGLEGLQSMRGLSLCPNLQVLLMDVNQVRQPLQPTRVSSNEPSAGGGAFAHG